MSIASHAPRVQGRLKSMWLAVAAALSIALWLVLEQAQQRPIHPQFAEMLMAARSMQAASRVLWMEKETRGLIPSAQADPNRTGMIGQEYTPITTTIGELPAKRTATNPDFARRCRGDHRHRDARPAPDRHCIAQRLDVGRQRARVQPARYALHTA